MEHIASKSLNCVVINFDFLRNRKSCLDNILMTLSDQRGPNQKFEDIELGFRLLQRIQADETVLSEHKFVVESLGLENAWYNKLTMKLHDCFEAGLQRELPLISIYPKLK